MYPIDNMTVRPIMAWPARRTKLRQSSRFKAGWRQTDALLRRELGYLKAKTVILELEVDDRDIRQDGWIRATARPRGPGVILSFDSKHGPLRYPCDTFTAWQDNLRAIALGLEALRKVDRYGVTVRGEQYKGFAALPAPSTSAPDLHASAEFLSRCANNAVSALEIVQDVDRFRQAAKRAAVKLHPDQGGDIENWKLYQGAKRLLEQHHGLT